MQAAMQPRIMALHCVSSTSRLRRKRPWGRGLGQNSVNTLRVARTHHNCDLRMCMHVEELRSLPASDRSHMPEHRRSHKCAGRGCRGVVRTCGSLLWPEDTDSHGVVAPSGNGERLAGCHVGALAPLPADTERPSCSDGVWDCGCEAACAESSSARSASGGLLAACGRTTTNSGFWECSFSSCRMRCPVGSLHGARGDGAVHQLDDRGRVRVFEALGLGSMPDKQPCSCPARSMPLPFQSSSVKHDPACIVAKHSNAFACVWHGTLPHQATSEEYIMCMSHSTARLFP